MQIKLLPENERPIEKTCKQGISKLSNSELIALIIHTGTKHKSAINLAEEVISLFPEGITGFGKCTLEDLLQINGVGNSKACSILAAFELGKRMASAPVLTKVRIESSDDVAELFMEELRYMNKEYFKSVLVNSKGEIIAIDEVSIGELSSTVVHPREVYTQAIKKSAAAVIFVHNHPSGDPTPSDEDVKTTQRLISGGEILGIKVLDHLIIGNGRFSSMRGMGYVK